MGWGNCGEDSAGRPIGYLFEATCDHPGCNAKIDRGLSYACGPMHGEGEWYCEGYFCKRHRLNILPIEDRQWAVCDSCYAKAKKWAASHPEDAIDFAACFEDYEGPEWALDSRLGNDGTQPMLTKPEWLDAVRDELIRQGLMADAAEIEARDIWEILSDHDRDPGSALARDPVVAAREGMKNQNGS